MSVIPVLICFCYLVYVAYQVVFGDPLPEDIRRPVWGIRTVGIIASLFAIITWLNDTYNGA